MNNMLINASQQDELRVAIVKNNQLIDLNIEPAGKNQKKANIYKGRISSIEPSLGAVFVDYGSDRHGFLPIKDIARTNLLNQQDADINDIDIKKALKINQEILVQVEKEERGNKGAALTTYISLAGSYLVLMPTNPKGGGISRRIEGESREQLREIIEQLDTPDGMSVIIRTAGVGKNLEELQWDLDLLLKYWEAVEQAATDTQSQVNLIHKESDVVIRSIRDHLKPDIDQIIIDDSATHDRAKQYLTKINPEFIKKLKHYNQSIPLFSAYQIEEQIEQAVSGEVKLKSGGSIVIDHTEALVTIDINSARATKGSSIEETAFNTNIEAAREIPRQLRIRDIGGLIVIDFIDMLSNSNQRKVEDALRDALKFDRARIQTGRISKFGLMEMSRQRLSASLTKSTQITCPRCKGRGSVRSIESTSLAILRSLEEKSIRTGGATLQLQLPLDVATYLLNEHREQFNKIQTRDETDVILLPNPHMFSPNFEIKIVKQDNKSTQTPSYKKIKTPRTEYTKKNRSPAMEEEPAVNQYLKEDLNKPRPRPKANEPSLIKRIKEAILGVNHDTKQNLTAPTKTNQRRTQHTRGTDTNNQRRTSRSNSNKSSRPSQPKKNSDDRRSQSNKAQPRANRTTKPKPNTRTKSPNKKEVDGNKVKQNKKDIDGNSEDYYREKQATRADANGNIAQSTPKRSNRGQQRNKNQSHQKKQPIEKNIKSAEKTKKASDNDKKTPKKTQEEKPQATSTKPRTEEKTPLTNKAANEPKASSQPLATKESTPSSEKKTHTGTPASSYIRRNKTGDSQALQQVKTQKETQKKETKES